MKEMTARLPDLDTIRDCLLGGAVGDALGEPVEFRSYSDIQELVGPQGVSGYRDALKAGAFTDDTQMTLWTAEGPIRAGDGVNWSLRSMGLTGYKAQVRRRLSEYGYTGPEPSDRLYLAAWNAQTCAKKLAASHMRRHRKAR